MYVINPGGLEVGQSIPYYDSALIKGNVGTVAIAFDDKALIMNNIDAILSNGEQLDNIPVDGVAKNIVASVIDGVIQSITTSTP